MAIGIKDGFLVSVTYPAGHVERLALIVDAKPDGEIKRAGAIHFGDRRYAKAYHFEPGKRQGRAVAWPEERVR